MGTKVENSLFDRTNDKEAHNEIFFLAKLGQIEKENLMICKEQKRSNVLN